MANSENLFRRESMDQLSQQTRTGPYVSATRLMPWMTLVAVLVLLLSFLIWAFAGKMQRHKPKPGNDVRVTQPNGDILLGKVVGISDNPQSLQELADIIQSDWVYKEVATAEYNYYITVEVNSPLEREDLVDAVITVDHVRPIFLMLNP